MSDFKSDRTATYCGADLGSTNLKVVLLAEDGAVVGRAQMPTPRGQDLAVDANQILYCVESLIISACSDQFAVRSIAVAGVGEDGALLDRNLEPLSPVLTWFDARRAALFEQIRPHLRELDDAGTALDPARTLVGWAWATRQVGSAKGQSWVALTDYPAVRWTRSTFMSDTLAARTAAWRVTENTWDEDNVVATLERPDRLPPVLPAGTVIGRMRSARLESACVLAPDAVVVAGGHDHPMGAWAIHCFDSDAVLDSMGTAEVVVGQSQDRSRVSPLDAAAGITHPGLTLLAVNELTRNIDWASRDQAVSKQIRRIAAGEQVPDGYVDSDVFQPGTAGGGQPAFLQNSDALPSLSKASAVLGALARYGNQAIEVLSLHTQGEIAVYAAGGWSLAPGWMRLKRHFLAASLRVIPEVEVTAVGAAMLAAWACGVPLTAGRSLLLDTADR